MMNSKDKEFLELYSDSEYEKPSVTIDSVIFRIKSEENRNYRKLPEKKLQVFLTKRAYSPFIDKYAIIGTFIDLQHELNDTMKLCVKNKTGLENYYYEQLFTFGERARDPRTRVISVSYLALTNDKQVLKNGDWFDIEISEEQVDTSINPNGHRITKLFKITLQNQTTALENLIEVDIEKNGLKTTKNIKVVKNDLAFDHIKMIFYAIERLKNKLEYTDIIFNLIDNEFTLTELKQCYELILGKKLLDANFRRKVSKMVVPINKYDEAKGHRTSQLFKHNPNWLNINID